MIRFIRFHRHKKVTRKITFNKRRNSIRKSIRRERRISPNSKERSVKRIRKEVLSNSFTIRVIRNVGRTESVHRRSKTIKIRKRKMKNTKDMMKQDRVEHPMGMIKFLTERGSTRK